MTHFHPATRRVVLLTTGFLVAIGLSACEGLGEGNRPERVDLRLGGFANLIEGSVNLANCETTNLLAAGTFSNGNLEDFSRRGTWTSSNPNVVDVSNGEIFVEGLNQSLVGGTIRAVSPGTATISFEFVGLTASTEIQVTPLQSIELRPDVDIATPGTQFVASMVGIDQDGEEQNFGGFARFSFAEEQTAETPIAQIGPNSGTIVPRAAGQLTLQGTVEHCGQSASAILDFELPQSIEVRREQPSDQPLVAGVSDHLTAVAVFSGGREQDVTAFSDFAVDGLPALPLDDAGQAPLDNRVSTFQANTLVRVTPFDFQQNPNDPESPTDADQVDAVRYVTAFDPSFERNPDLALLPVEAEDVARDTISSAQIDVEVVEGLLDTLTVTPAGPILLEFGDTADLTTTGTFNDGAITLDLTRTATYLSSDSGLVLASNDVITRGRLFSGGTAGEVTVSIRFFKDVNGDGLSVDENGELDADEFTIVERQVVVSDPDADEDGQDGEDDGSGS